MNATFTERRTTTLPQLRDFVPRARVTVSFYQPSGTKGKPFVIWLDELPAWMARSKGTLVYAVTAEGDAP